MSQQKTEKFYTVSARLLFSALIVALIVILILSISIGYVANRSAVAPSSVSGTTTSTIAPGVTTTVAPVTVTGAHNITVANTTPIVVSVGCTSTSSYKCINPVLNYSTGNLTVALSQNTGYNWTSVTVRFVTLGTVYSNGVPELSWSPPQAVNVTGGLKSNVTKYINIPITSGPVAIGSDITGSIWAKYQLQVGEQVSYANMSSAIIVVRRA